MAPRLVQSLPGAMDGWTRAAFRRHGAGTRAKMGAKMGAMTGARMSWLAAGMAVAGLLALTATEIRLGAAAPVRAATAKAPAPTSQSSLYLNVGAREAVAAGWQ
jgi:hypothetical protein